VQTKPEGGSAFSLSPPATIFAKTAGFLEDITLVTLDAASAINFLEGALQICVIGDCRSKMHPHGSRHFQSATPLNSLSSFRLERVNHLIPSLVSFDTLIIRAASVKEHGNSIHDTTRLASQKADVLGNKNGRKLKALFFRTAIYSAIS